MAGCNWVQLLPFHVQVWLEKPVPVVALPPNSRNWLVAGSKTIEAPVRAEGLRVGLWSVQVVPVRVQVSRNIVPGRLPPNRTSSFLGG